MTPRRFAATAAAFAIALAAGVGAGEGSARAEGARFPGLGLTFRPRLEARGFSSVLPSGGAFTLSIRSAPIGLRDGEATRSSDEGMYAPLRGVWTGVADRCAARICSTEAAPKTAFADEALSQLGVVTVLLSAFLPKGEVFAIRSELTGQKIRFTPTTFATTGAGVRVWGTF